MFGINAVSFPPVLQRATNLIGTDMKMAIASALAYGCVTFADAAAAAANEFAFLWCSCSVDVFFLSFLFLACNNIKDFGLCVCVCENHIIDADKRLCYGTFAHTTPHTTPRTPFILSEWKKRIQQEWVRERVKVKTIENSKNVRKTAHFHGFNTKEITLLFDLDAPICCTLWPCETSIRLFAFD